MSVFAKLTHSEHLRAGLRSIAARFLRQDRGVVAVMAALVIPVLLMMTASTMDYANAARLRAASSSSLDASLLAAARALTLGQIDDDEVEEFVNEYFEANMIGKDLDTTAMGEVTASFDETTGLISGSVEGTIPALFSGLLNPEGVTVGVEAQVTVSLLNVELALVLDVTGSMRGSRLRALQEAATTLVETLIPDDQQNSIAEVRVSLVPYSDLVNVGDFEEDITGYDFDESCVYERAGAVAFTDTAPFGPVGGTGTDDDGFENYPPWGNGLRSSKTIVNDPSNFRGYICGNPELIPLTSDADDLVDEIDDFTAGGWTAGHIGIQWGWYTLSPNFVDVWPAASTPTTYDDNETLKAMVIMTDGAFNTWYEPGQGSSFGQGESLCDAIRQSGIQIYTVGLYTRSSAENFLRDCASTPDHYFDATSRSGLVEAFREIGQLLTAIRITS